MKPFKVISTYGKRFRMSDEVKEMIWSGFLSAGCTSHSSRAQTLPYIINRCQKEGVPYRLTAQPGLGYMVERVK